MKKNRHSLIIVIFSVCIFIFPVFCIANSNKTAQVTNDSLGPYMSEMFWSTISGWYYIDWNVAPAVCEYHGKTVSLSQGNRHQGWDDLQYVWIPCYNTASYIKKVRKIALSINDFRCTAIADIWEAYNFLCLTNLYGNIPYSEVIQELPSSTPKYDSQESIYYTLTRKLLMAGLSIGINPSSIDSSSDAIFKGNLMKWKKFANTLLIRYSMYMSDAAPDSAKAYLNEILSDPIKYPVMESNEDNAFYHFDGTIHRSQMYQLSKSKIDEAPFSNVFIERLISLKDPRLPIFARPAKKAQPDPNAGIIPSNKGTEKYAGHLYGITSDNAYSSIWNGGINYASRIGEYFRTEDSNGIATSECSTNPLSLATYSEMLFFLAEAREREIISKGLAKNYYEKAIKASLDQYKTSFTSTKYVAAFGSDALQSEEEYLMQADVNYDSGRGRLTMIAEQKWIASFLLSFEPYFDHRRTMLPKLRASSGANDYAYAGSGTKFPSRADYPISEAANNYANYTSARALGFSEAITGDVNKNTVLMWLIKPKGITSLQMPVYKEPAYNADYPAYASNTCGATFKKWYIQTWNHMLWWINDSTENRYICLGDSFNGHSVSGAYDKIYKTSNGCDSIITTHLLVSAPQIPVIMLSDTILKSSLTIGNQWYCNNTIISGATNDTYIPTVKGDYHVVTKSNSCPAQTSNIIAFGTLDIKNRLKSSERILYPNPTYGEFEIKFDDSYNNSFKIEIYNSLGILIRPTQILVNENTIKVNLSKYPSGTYFIKMSNKDENYTSLITKY